MSEMLKAKVEKYLVCPVEARWGAIASAAERQAYVEDAVIDLGRVEGEVITAALHKVRQGWKYPRRPAVADFAAAAKEILADRPKNRTDGENAQARANRVNDEAFRYAAALIWDTPEGRTAIAGGYAREMREWVRVEAAQQAYAGGPINVRIPAAQVAEWKARAEMAERLRDAPRPKEPIRRVGEFAKQPRASEAAE
ncbi:hypothetical protein KL86APRO_30169 [uncultured Alphaproteobacteria bacterium]|uniref:Uncharacterized protein n=1 Tax=uncultured Alphaproteobacteria bacterium TaxID=91750 RepID=A0A212KLZ5_9PROT|nr:hypothetical protein KL86APRO_30169 [uncultured Alphaproteobacteria bacterium]